MSSEYKKHTKENCLRSIEYDQSTNMYTWPTLLHYEYYFRVIYN